MLIFQDNKRTFIDAKCRLRMQVNDPSLSTSSSSLPSRNHSSSLSSDLTVLNRPCITDYQLRKISRSRNLMKAANVCRFPLTGIKAMQNVNN